jgi:DNA-binding NtrC family response regulator
MISHEDEQDILFQELAYFDTFAKDVALPDELENIERERIVLALELAEGNRSKQPQHWALAELCLYIKLKNIIFKKKNQQVFTCWRNSV